MIEAGGYILNCRNDAIKWNVLEYVSAYKLFDDGSFDYFVVSEVPGKEASISDVIEYMKKLCIERRDEDILDNHYEMILKSTNPLSPESVDIVRISQIMYLNHEYGAASAILDEVDDSILNRHAWVESLKKHWKRVIGGRSNGNF